MKVLITGGQGDIAKATVKKIEARGWEVLAPSRQEMDVSSIESVSQYLAGKNDIDVLINNAGFMVVQPIDKAAVENDVRTIDVILRGTFIVTGEFYKENPDATVVNIGSVAGTRAFRKWSSYCAAKSGVILATKCWAKEGKKAVCVSPSSTATKMRTPIFPDEDQSTILQPADLADVILKAIDGDFKWGSNIEVDVDNVEEVKKIKDEF